MAVFIEGMQPSLTVNPTGAWENDTPAVNLGLEQLFASLSICPQRESRTRKAGSPVRRDHATHSFSHTRILKLNTRPRKKSSKPKNSRSARMQMKDLPISMQFPKDFGVFSFRSCPDLSARWMQLAARVRMTETPEGSKQQPTSMSKPSFALSIGDSRRKTTKKAAFVAGPGSGVGTGIFESSPQPCKQRLAFKPFGLLDLPLEMREAIYSSILQQRPNSNTNGGKLHLSLDHHRKSSSATTPTPKISRLPYAAFALLSTSKQIRHEALLLLYRLNTFYARAIKSLPAILALPHAPANLLTLDLSFTGLKHKESLFTSLHALDTLPQLRTLNLTFDFSTLRALSNSCLSPIFFKGPFEICAHHPLTDMTARTEHADLIFSGSVPKRSETRRLRIIFRHASSAAALKPQRPKKGEAPEARVLDCVPCAVLRGFREVQRLAEEGRKKATEGQVEVQLGQGWIMTAGGGSAGVVKGKGGKGDGKAAVPTVVVLRTKELGEGAQAAEPTGGTGKGTGLWPILAPEPSSCTDFSGVCACDRRARCRHCRLGRG